MRFAHIADCHLGSWREQKLQELNLKAFEKAIDACTKSKLDFVLITGDLFDNAMPPVDILKKAAEKLRQLKEAGVKCYVIAGSHDYSVSGKTFLDVLEKAGLCENVEKIEDDELILTEGKEFVIAGISGKKQELEKELIKKVKVPKLGNKFKILALHTTIEENKTSDFVEGIKTSELPKGFDYYALGHIHKPFNHENKIVYPGPLFPNNFAELEELGNGGFFIVNFDGKKLSLEREEIKLKDILNLEFNADSKNPFLLTSEIIGRLKKENINDKIILIRIEGTLKDGKTSEVNFNEIKQECAKAFILLKNISKLKSPEANFELEIKSDNVDEIEKLALEKLNQEFKLIAEKLLHALDIEKIEGETLATFEKRLMENVNKIVGIE
jgi:exonuclease SbcD